MGQYGDSATVLLVDVRRIGDILISLVFLLLERERCSEYDESLDRSLSLVFLLDLNTIVVTGSLVPKRSWTGRLVLDKTGVTGAVINSFLTS